MDFLKEHRCILNYGEIWCNFHCTSRVGGHCSCRVAVSLGSLHHKHSDKLPPQGMCVWSLLMDVEPPDDVNVSGCDEPAIEPASNILNGGAELPLMSHRQCRLIDQQLRIRGVCLEESFSALMHGNFSDGRFVVLEVCAARDSPVTHGVRQRLQEITAAERWTSRDHDLRKSAGRRSALQNLDAVLHSFVPVHTIHCPLVQLVSSKTIVPWRCSCHSRVCVRPIDYEVSACDLGYLPESTG